MDEERSVRTYQVLKRYLFSEPLLRGVPLSRNEATIPYMPMNLQKKKHYNSDRNASVSTPSSYSHTSGNCVFPNGTVSGKSPSRVARH